MNVDNLARDAFTAQAFVGGEAAQILQGQGEDTECALEEIRTSLDEDAKIFHALMMFWRAHAGHENPEFDQSDVTNLSLAADVSKGFSSIGRVLAGDDPSTPDISVEEKRHLRLTGVQLKMLLSTFRPRLALDTYSTIEKRLALFLDPDEWESGDALPDTVSFKLMLQFLADQKELHTPRVSLSREGNFVISWRSARDKLTTLEFCPDKTIRWLVFAPPPRGSSKKERAAGDSSDIKSLMDHLDSFDALKWMQRAE